MGSEMCIRDSTIAAVAGNIPAVKYVIKNMTSGPYSMVGLSHFVVFADCNFNSN